MSDCNNNCEAVAGLNEAAANLVQYSKLINSWLNGGSNQTVNVGGTNIPTLLGLACEIRQLVGVWPDGLTIKMDPANKKIYVPLKPNSGVHVGNQGLFIDSSDFLQIGGGLAKDPTTGQLYVDFDQMPTSKFDAILETFRKGLRLPKWLTANKNFYVDKNHAAASDTLDEGRGESPSLPFKTIQACVNYVCDNYNLSSFNAIINVANGEYVEILTLPQFTASTGGIIIKPASANQNRNLVVIKNNGNNNMINSVGSNWTINNVTFEYTSNLSAVTSNLYRYLIHVNSGHLYLSGCNFKILTQDAVVSGQLTLSLMAVFNTGILTLSLNTINNTSLNLPPATSNLNINVFSTDGGTITFPNGPEGAVQNFYVSGHCTRFANVNNSGKIIFGSTAPTPLVFQANAVSGKRYEAAGGGIINTNGRGAEYLPGSIAGTVEASTYSWYK